MDANWRGCLELMGPAILAEMERLEQEVPPPLWERVAGLLATVDDEGFSRGRRGVEAEMAAILAHFPGLQPAWEVVWAHLRNEFVPDCGELGKLHPHCSLFEDPEKRPA
jgi:hypothetical protein